jgi:hypothetical protein
VRDSGRRAPEIELLSVQELCLGKPDGVEEGSGDGHLFPWGPHWETWESAHMPGAYMWKMVLGRLPLAIAQDGHLQRRTISVAAYIYNLHH